MNIKEAKEQIQNAMTAYFTKDPFGGYVIPMEQQRPVFLMGPPGIGKTAIMEQIAAELGVGLVSYSMTHHTRQSALGLPFITRKTYGGREYDVSEYTMSEIIASVYDLMEESGIREGILFLDEINCVSETLAPSMLQFLQYKIFGRHRVPDGWIVVTAGNPPEYNNSVREFDIVTWDRLKRMDVEPDYDVWKEYAYRKGIHPSITTYLDVKKSDFYQVETTVDGKRFVTARGWSDLSDMIKLYEQHKLTVDQKLVCQYLQDSRIAKDFAVYYDLFNKYRSDYQVEKILSGKADDAIKDRARQARFDERLALLGLLLDGIAEHTRAVYSREQTMTQLMDTLKQVRVELSRPDADAAKSLEKQIEQKRAALANGRRSFSMSRDEQYSCESAIQTLEEQRQLLMREHPEDNAAAFQLVKADFDKRAKDLKKLSADTGKRLSNLFAFCEELFTEGQELLILVTELTINYYSAYFISRYGCKAYFAHNKELLFYERQQELITTLAALNLDLDEDL
ncbi:MAG: AAA domain-containing protein [Oscillospiraceae bacterium]|nr:AAA domain-containing protein [Oscillospiraceae bacterium]